MLSIIHLSNGLLSYLQQKKKGEDDEENSISIYALIEHNSKSVKQEILERGYVPHMPYKRKRGQKETACQKKYSSAKKRWVVYGKNKFMA